MNVLVAQVAFVCGYEVGVEVLQGATQRWYEEVGVVDIEPRYVNTSDDFGGGPADKMPLVNNQELPARNLKNMLMVYDSVTCLTGQGFWRYEGVSGGDRDSDRGGHARGSQQLEL